MLKNGIKFPKSIILYIWLRVVVFINFTLTKIKIGVGDVPQKTLKNYPVWVKSV